MSAYESGSKSIQANSPLVRDKSAIGWWPRAIAVLGALLLAAGALIALFRPVMLVSAHDEINGAVHIYAGYFASRNLALTIMLIAVLRLGAKGMLRNLLLLVAFIQLLDAAMDVIEGRWPVAIGVVVLAVLFFMASGSLSGLPFWKIHAGEETD
jgi:hypothetical protein